MDRRDRTKNLVCEILCYSGPALKVHKKEKKAMKYMFASDIHGSAYYCKKMLEAYDKEKYRDMENEKVKEILIHTREGAEKISALEILYMLGLV